MSEEQIDIWRAMKETDKEDKEQRRKDLTQRLLNLKGKYRIVQLTPYHFRINGVLDIYPTNGRFHNIKTGKRGPIPWKVLYS